MRKIRSVALPLVLGVVSGVILVVACGGMTASEAQTGGCTSRSAVAGTWAVTFTVGGTINCVLHLAGSDAALTGAAACTGYDGGPVTGDLAGTRLRLNLNLSTGGPHLADVIVSAGNTSATGTVALPRSATPNGQVQTVPVTMAVQ
jgi:hypothetical protein